MGLNQYSGHRVIINKNGHPKQVLRHVRSIMEISNEELEIAEGLSFHHEGTWKNFRNEDFDRITIEKERGDDGKPRQ
jgi:hypothetical protein